MRKRWFRPVEELIQEHEAEEDALYSTTWKNRIIIRIIVTVVEAIPCVAVLVYSAVEYYVLWGFLLIWLGMGLLIYAIISDGVTTVRYYLFRYRKAKERERKKQEEFLKTYKYLKKDNEQEKDQSASQTDLTADAIHEEPENKQ